MANVETLRVPECAQCRAICCRVSIIPLSADYKWDRDLIAGGHAKQDYIPAYDNDPEDYEEEGWVMKRQASGSCKFLDDSTGFCTIYNKRPYCCRTWSCLTREDATRVSITAVDQGVDPRGTPLVDYLKKKLPNIHKQVMREANKELGAVPEEFKVTPPPITAKLAKQYAKQAKVKGEKRYQPVGKKKAK